MTNEPSGTPSSSGDQRRDRLPKSRRLLKSAEFRQVYDRGFRLVTAPFVAFCWQSGGTEAPRVGFTAPRALGNATLRNRMRRRVRETIRRKLWRASAGWWIVFNIRRASLTASQSQLDHAIEKVVERCNA